MRMTTIHNELMRTRKLPIQCKTNEVDSHSGKYINIINVFNYNFLKHDMYTVADSQLCSQKQKSYLLSN